MTTTPSPEARTLALRALIKARAAAAADPDASLFVLLLDASNNAASMACYYLTSELQDVPQAVNSAHASDLLSHLATRAMHARFSL